MFVKNNCLRIKKPELIAPAGDWDSLHSAISAGADSIYFGLKGLSMRNFAVNFDILEIKKIIQTLHNHQKKGYLALNVIAYNHEKERIKTILTEAKCSGVDAVILWDMGIFSLAKKLGLRVHLSTQASVANIEALKYYSQLGVRRVVLARECRLTDINGMVAELKENNIDCQVEAFIHGAMCVSISGRCFLSEYSFSKSANRGECLQPCRREYFISDKEGECQYILGQDYILSPKDLCTIDFLDQLIAAKIDSFKIEGRIRSPEYVKVVTSVYREAIDAYFNGMLTVSVKAELKHKLKAVYNRGFSSGFFWGKPTAAISRRLEGGYEKIYIGEVVKFYKKINVAEVKVRSRGLKKGDEILCVGKNTPASFAVIDGLQVNHQFVDSLERGNIGGVKLPFTVRRNDKLFVWKKKELQPFLTKKG